MILPWVLPAAFLLACLHMCHGWCLHADAHVWAFCVVEQDDAFKLLLAFLPCGYRHLVEPFRFQYVFALSATAFSREAPLWVMLMLFCAASVPAHRPGCNTGIHGRSGVSAWPQSHRLSWTVPSSMFLMDRLSRV